MRLCTTVNLNTPCNAYTFSGKDDYLHQLEDTRLYAERPILWNHHGIEIRSQVIIPDDQKVKVEVKIYDSTKPEFVFPEGFSIKSYVYRIRVATTDKHFVTAIYITMRNFPQPQSKEFLCPLEASGNPNRWTSLKPIFSFSGVEESHFYHQDRAVNILMRNTTCYFAIAVNVNESEQSLHQTTQDAMCLLPMNMSRVSPNQDHKVRLNPEQKPSIQSSGKSIKVNSSLQECMLESILSVST